MKHPSNTPVLMDDLVDLFTYHPPADRRVTDRYETIRGAALTLARIIIASCPGGADCEAAIRKVREAVMTANAAIACEPPRNGFDESPR
jgi:hypothetical protein